MNAPRLLLARGYRSELTCSIDGSNFRHQLADFLVCGGVRKESVAHHCLQQAQVRLLLALDIHLAFENNDELGDL